MITHDNAYATNIGRVTVRKMMRELEQIADSIRRLDYRDPPRFSVERERAVGALRAIREQLSCFVRHHTYGEITAGTRFKLHPSDACEYIKLKDGVHLYKDGVHSEALNDLEPNRIIFVRIERAGAESFE